MKEKSNILEEKNFRKKELIKLLIVVILFLAEISYLIYQGYAITAALSAHYQIFNNLSAVYVRNTFYYFLFTSLVTSGLYLLGIIIAYSLFLFKKKYFLSLFTIIELLFMLILLDPFNWYLAFPDFLKFILPVVLFLFSLILLIILYKKKDPK